MTTTSVTAATASTAAVTASKAASKAGQSIISAMGTGSGIDVNALAQNLTDATRVPQQQVIQAKIDKCNATISGDGALLSSLATLNTAFTALENSSSLETASVQSTDTSSFLATATGSADIGFHSVQVSSVATAQRNISTGYAAGTTKVNGTTAFDLTITPTDSDQSEITLSFSSGATVNDVITAINAAGGTMTAKLTDVGGTNPYKIVLSSNSTGSTNGFTITDSSSVLGFSQLAAAGDATLTVDGVTLTRSTNDITDAITDVTLNIFNAATAATYVQVSRDTTQLKSKIATLVAAYNDLEKTLKTVSDAASSDTAIGGTLVNDSLISRLRDQVRTLMTDDSSSPGTSITSFRDMGVTIQVDGRFTIDDTTLQAALDSNFSEIVTALSADISNQSASTATSRGLAGDAVEILTALADTSSSALNTSPVQAQIKGAKTRISSYETDISNLDVRMAALLERYKQQFSAMDALLGQIKSEQTGLTATFAGLAAMYK